MKKSKIRIFYCKSDPYDSLQFRGYNIPYHSTLKLSLLAIEEQPNYYIIKRK